jgi:4'-phosphopantetheinyl transferase
MASYIPLLSATELQRRAQFRLPEDRDRFTLARVMLRLVLALELGCDPQSVDITLDTRGKPRVNHHPAAPAFSIAHSGNIVVLAVSASGSVGIDVEWTGRDIEPVELIPHTCSAAETGWLDTLSSAQKLSGFLFLWTLKEAYLKATGEGLAQDPRRITFDLGDVQDPRLREPAYNKESQTWKFFLKPEFEEHILALATLGQPHQGVLVPQWMDVETLLGPGSLTMRTKKRVSL